MLKFWKKPVDNYADLISQIGIEQAFALLSNTLDGMSDASRASGDRKSAMRYTRLAAIADAGAKVAVAK